MFLQSKPLHYILQTTQHSRRTKSFVEAFASLPARRLDVPVPLPEELQAELVRDLSGRERVRQILCESR